MQSTLPSRSWCRDAWPLGSFASPDDRTLGRGGSVSRSQQAGHTGIGRRGTGGLGTVGRAAAAVLLRYSAVKTRPVSETVYIIIWAQCWMLTVHKGKKLPILKSLQKCKGMRTPTPLHKSMCMHVRAHSHTHTHQKVLGEKEVFFNA